MPALFDGGRNKESYIPFREHQHAFAATIHYTMLIAAEILNCRPVTVFVKYIMIVSTSRPPPYVLDLTIQDVFFPEISLSHPYLEYPSD
jgi:hypothetical protein